MTDNILKWDDDEKYLVIDPLIKHTIQVGIEDMNGNLIKKLYDSEQPLDAEEKE